MALPITPVVDITVNLPGVGSTRDGFDLALIVTENDVISAGTRVVVYDSLEDMVDAGFAVDSLAYLAAVPYFAAQGKPSQVAIGLWDSGETRVEALTACRAANPDWYIAYFPDADNADHLLLAAYMEAASPFGQYFINTSDADVKNDATGNLFAALKAAGYKRTHGMYSTTAHAVMSVAGFAMANTSDNAGSDYTIMFKTLPGVTAESLTTAEVTGIEANYGNVYVTRGGNTGYEKGNQFSGDWFDEIIGLDKLANDIEVSVANFLYQSGEVPQTEGGMQQLRAVIATACERSRVRGFVAPGEWTGDSILSIRTGDELPDGYLVLSDAISSQSAEDRAARIAPNVYALVKLSGAIQSVAITVNVNR